MARYQIIVEAVVTEMRNAQFTETNEPVAFEVNYLPLRTANTNTALSRAAILEVTKLEED